MRFFATVFASLKPFLQSLSHRWQQLSQREQWLTSVALVSLFIWVIWQGVFVSLADRQALAQKRMVASRAQLTLIQQQAEEVVRLRALGATVQSDRSTPMDRVVHQLAAKHKLTLQRVKNRGEVLDIGLANARFDQLMSWLTLLEQQYQIRVKTIRLESTETSGLVEVERLELERG